MGFVTPEVSDQLPCVLSNPAAGLHGTPDALEAGGVCFYVLWISLVPPDLTGSTSP